MKILRILGFIGMLTTAHVSLAFTEDQLHIYEFDTRTTVLLNAMKNCPTEFQQISAIPASRFASVTTTDLVLVEGNVYAEIFVINVESTALTDTVEPRKLATLTIKRTDHLPDLSSNHPPRPSSVFECTLQSHEIN